MKCRLAVFFMLNYANLNDVEFEYLCQDVMSKKLNTKLRRFAPGRDGGIDLSDNSFVNNIIVQVKHYMNSSVDQLISSLKKEVPKVEENKPDQYYVCCSKQLSPQKVKEIYELFSDYMESKENIFTLVEIEDFLTKPENIEILKKHYKLWISSTSILEDIFTKDIYIDCEALLSNIKNDEKFFVQTSAYNHALDSLSKNRTLFITGDPGVGKTMTSKMIILHYAAQGYRVRYTTDGTDLSALKKSLSQSPESREIILLDDCLGQAYFNMKETQGNELLSIIKHVNIYKNKLLILNSRITIYREAQARTPGLVNSFENKEYKVYVLNMDAISELEKALILYNHLFFNCIDNKHFNSIKKDKNYLKIIRHPNYNPRIIEFVCNKNRYEDICPENYYEFIIENLNNPSRVWADEYERRLSVVDRILLLTVYSLTNNTVQMSLANQCFGYRIQHTCGIDLTVNQFTNSLSRLQKSFVKIVDERGQKMLTMVNPSINDYLDAYLLENVPEKAKIIDSCISVRQYKRLLENEEFETKIASVFSDKSIIKFRFENDRQKSAYISFYVATHKVLDSEYKQFIDSYLSNIDDVNIYERKNICAANIIELLMNSDICEYYQINNYFIDMFNLEKLLTFFDLEELVKVISYIDCLYKDEFRDCYIKMAKSVIKGAVECYCTDIPSENYDLDIGSIVKSCSVYHYGYGPDVDTDEAAEIIRFQILDQVIDEVVGFIDILPVDVQPEKEFIDGLEIDISGCDELVDSYIESDNYDDDMYYDSYRTNDNEIALIFK